MTFKRFTPHRVETANRSGRDERARVADPRMAPTPARAAGRPGDERNEQLGRQLSTPKLLNREVGGLVENGRSESSSWQKNSRVRGQAYSRLANVMIGDVIVLKSIVQNCFDLTFVLDRELSSAATS